MRIDCPSCAAGYDVPDSKLAGRKTVRCVRCGHQWAPDPVPAPADSPPAALPPAAPRPDSDRPPSDGPPSDGSASDWPGSDRGDGSRSQIVADAGQPRLAPLATPPRGRFGLRLAWAVSGLLVAMALAAAFVWRAEVARAWPPSLRVYAALGLAHNAR